MGSVPAEKTCKGCAETRPLTEFREAARYKFGRYSLCRTCERRSWQERNARPDVATANADRLRAWRKANPGKVRDQTAKARASRTAEQREAVAAYMRDYWKRTSKKREYDQTYRRRHRQELFARYQANIEMSREAVRRRRARKRDNGEFAILPRELRRLYSSPCAACRSPGPIHMDHIVPISRGGRHSIGNIQPLCQTCNQSKSKSLMAEWRYRR